MLNVPEPLQAGTGAAATGPCARVVGQTEPLPAVDARRYRSPGLLTGGTAIPMVVALTGANGNDATRLLPLLDTIPPVRGRRG